MTAVSHLTDCGIPGIRWVPYGFHACHLYEGPEAYAESLVAYFLAGLYLGEKCVWIAAPPLGAAEARLRMRAAWSRCDDAISRGALTILDFEDWYRVRGGMDPERLVDALLSEEARALAEGYRALRVAGNMAGLRPSERERVHEYEELLNAHLAERRIVALCSYDRAMLANGRQRGVESTHHCTLHNADGWWQIRSHAERFAARV